MSIQGTHEHIIAQMHMELEVARNRIDALAEQSRKAAEEIASLRNQNAANSSGLPPFSIPWT